MLSMLPRAVISESSDIGRLEAEGVDDDSNDIKLDIAEVMDVDEVASDELAVLSTQDDRVLDDSESASVDVVAVAGAVV